MSDDRFAALQLGAEWLTVRAGGLNRYADGLAGGLREHGVDQHWLVMGDEDLRPCEHTLVQAVAKPTDRLLNRWVAMRGAFRNARQRPWDVVISHFALYAYPVAGELAKLPHVVHFHGPWADESRAEKASGLAVWAKRRLERHVYRTAEHFITLSQAFANVLASRYGVDPDAIRVIPGGVDADRFDVSESGGEARRRLGWDADRPTILCVRRLVHRMGLEQLVEAMALIRKRVPEALLLIAGKGPITGLLQEAVERLGLEDSVRLLGFVPDEELPYAYRAADVSVVPSQSLEGFGLIIPESLAAGTPALVTPVGGMPEVVRDLDSDLVLPGTDSGVIAEALIGALTGRAALPSAEACRAYARERFAWPVVAGRALEVYREAIEAHG